MYFRYLLVLLNQMFADAGHEVLQYQEDTSQRSTGLKSRCISAFTFIMLCTRNSASQASLYTQAETMLSRLVLPLLYSPRLDDREQSLAFFVPVLDIKRYIGSVEKAVEVALAVDNVISVSQSINSSHAESRTNAAKLMEQLGSTGLGYINNEENEKLACDAIRDAESKRNDLAVSNASWPLFVDSC